MPIQSDLNIDVAKFKPEAVLQSTTDFNNAVIRMMEGAPRWYEVKTGIPQSSGNKILIGVKVGAAKYREMRRNGETPFPKPTYLESGINITIPSREPGRDIPCRMFMPEKGEAKGIYMHTHGGGWVLQSEKDQDPLLKATADGANVAVISIGYRLAPEDPFPRGIEDCFDAAEYLVDHAVAKFGAPLKFMGGESAGGHLTLLTVFHLLETRPNFHLSGLLLNCGVYDMSFLPTTRHFPKDLILTPDIMDHYIQAFLPGMSLEGRKSPCVSPYYKDLTGLELPSALFICGTEDCLLDDTMAMSIKWQMTGAETIVKIWSGYPHAFMVFPPQKLPGVSEVRQVMNEYLLERL